MTCPDPRVFRVGLAECWKVPLAQLNASPWGCSTTLRTPRTYSPAAASTMKIFAILLWCCIASPEFRPFAPLITCRNQCRIVYNDSPSNKLHSVRSWEFFMARESNKYSEGVDAYIEK